MSKCPYPGYIFLMYTHIQGIDACEQDPAPPNPQLPSPSDTRDKLKKRKHIRSKGKFYTFSVNI